MSNELRSSGANSKVSIPAYVHHRNISLSVLDDTDPTIYDPVAISGDSLYGLHGTAVFVDDPIAVVDVTHGSVHRHNVRNVLTYSAGAESTFALLEEGTLVFYDPSATMPNNVFLSASPLNASGDDNVLFGFVVLDQDETEDNFPKGSLGAGGSYGCAVMQF